jgi:chromosome segregation ATPase
MTPDELTDRDDAPFAIEKKPPGALSVDDLTKENASLHGALRAIRGKCDASSFSAARASAAKANALAHLRAAEDHVALLLSESRAKVDALARETEKTRASASASASRAALATMDANATAGDAGVASDADAKERELALLRAEVREYAATQAEMDAEAEERDAELKNAYDHIAKLQDALRRKVNTESIGGASKRRSANSVDSGNGDGDGGTTENIGAVQGLSSN